MRRALLVLALAGCPGTPQKPTTRPDPSGGGTDSDAQRRARLVAELQDEILASYERDELPEVETTMIPRQVGPARINVGPGDVLFGDDVRRMAWSRWPLQLTPGTPTTVRSKHLEIHLSNDRPVSAAWMSDEISWRITLCNRIAVIPLRMTGLYAHDGDRWVQVFEHMSFGRIPELTSDGKLRGAPLVSPAEACPPPPGPADRCPVFDHPKREVTEELARAVLGLLSAQGDKIKASVSPARATDDPTQPAPAVIIAPDPEGEWHGESLEAVRIVDGKLKLEESRVGVIGTSQKNATVAYWIGNLVADLRQPEGKVRLRATFVFEKRSGTWVVVQAHISQAIDDIDLALRIYGTALIAEKPLQITCDDGRRSVVGGTASSSRYSLAPASPDSPD